MHNRNRPSTTIRTINLGAIGHRHTRRLRAPLQSFQARHCLKSQILKCTIAIGNRHTRRHRASIQSVQARHRPRSQISINAQSQSAITGYQRDRSKRNRNILQLDLKREQSSTIKTNNPIAIGNRHTRRYHIGHHFNRSRIIVIIRDHKFQSMYNRNRPSSTIRTINLGAIGHRQTCRHRTSLKSAQDHRYHPRSQISINAQSQSAINDYQND